MKLISKILDKIATIGRICYFIMIGSFIANNTYNLNNIGLLIYCIGELFIIKLTLTNIYNLFFEVYEE